MCILVLHSLLIVEVNNIPQSLFVMPSLKKRGYIALHMLVGRTVSPSVTFSFPINNSRMPWPTFLILCPQIRPVQQRNRVYFEITGSKVKVIAVKYAKTNSEQLLKNALTYLPHTLSTNPSCAAEESYIFWDHWVKDQGQRHKMSQNRFRSITRATPWPTFLKLGSHICPGQQRNVFILRSLGQRSRSPGSNVPKPIPINCSRMPWPTFLILCPQIRPVQQRSSIYLEITGSKIKVTRIKCPKTVSDL